MKPISCSVEWYEKWANDPILQIVVDEIPNREDLRYKHKQTLWFAEKDGYVSFFYWEGPNNNGGYYGSNYKITLEDESTVTLLGPWSSNSAAVNMQFIPQCLDVSIKTEKEKLSCWCSGAVSLEFALEAIKLYEEPIELVVKNTAYGYIFVPQRRKQ